MGLKEKIGIERALAKLAAFQCRHYKKIIVLSLLITVILGYGATGLHFQGDIAKEMPQDLPVFALQDMIESEFKGEEFMIIAVCLDRETGAKDIPRDVRDPKVIASVVELHERLEAESSIEKVQSVATHFQHGVPEDMAGVKKKLASLNNTGRFFNDDFSIMLIYASPIAGLSEEKVKNNGGRDARDIRLSFQGTEIISPVGPKVVNINTLNSWSSKEVEITMHVKEEAPNGVYPIPVSCLWTEYHFDPKKGDVDVTARSAELGVYFNVIGDGMINIGSVPSFSAFSISAI